MRRRIIFLFIILLVLQAVQVAMVSYSIRRLQTAVRQVTITGEGREAARSAVNYLDRFRDDVVLIAGMNFPVSGLKRLRTSWQSFTQRSEAMDTIARQLSFDPVLLAQLKENIEHGAAQITRFEEVALNESPDETYTAGVHDAAFEIDEAVEGAKKILDVVLAKFVYEEESAIAHERVIHDLPIQVVSTIGAVIGCILIGVGLFAVTKIVNPLIDLTEKYKVAMKKLKQEQDMAIALEKARATAQAKSDFLANMSHELRTPLNAILGFSQLLEESNLEGKQRNYLDLIMSSGRHLVRIINDILDFSKLEAGKIKLEPMDFNLEKAISEVVKIAATRMSENPLDTYIDYPPDLPRHIHSDPARIKQVLVNLLGNAIKFTPQGEVGLIIRLDNEIEHRDDEIPLRFTVKDSGIGIPRDKIGKIFESFTQADESTTRKYGGTGLGLTITKYIVEAMGGRIWVESESGKGSQFTFTLNVKKGKAVDPWEIDETAKKSLKGKTAFIIDDNTISRKVIKKTCEMVGVDVLDMVDSGQAALAELDELALHNTLPDVILCDILMSEMYGYEVAQKLRANRKFDRTKIIAVTKISEADVVHYIRDDCFNDYLTKPVIEKDLVYVLAKELGYKRTGEEKRAEQQPPALADVSNFKDIRILVAEDNVTNVMLLKEYLDQLKCKADYAYNGQEAIQRLEAREYDLCLMDLQMPVLNGIEATKIIRSRISKTLPIIAMTAAVLKEDRQRANEAGMNDFLEKPLNIAKLKEKILQYGRPEKDGGKDSAAAQIKYKALVVDDNSMNLKLLTAFLKKLQCACDTAVNGEEAVAKAKTGTYDICFMDIQMPVMSGVEATKIIREEVAKDLPIIAVTAVSDYTRERSLADGMSDYIGKPVDREKLKEILAKHCRKTA